MGTLSAVLLLTLALVVSSSAEVHPSSASPTSGATLLSRGPEPTARSGALPPEGPYLASVTSTLVLFNRTVLPGYQLTNSTTFPSDPVYDPDNGTVWVGGGAVSTTGVDVVNATTDVGIRILPTGYQVRLAYDNRSNTVWVTGGTTANTVTVYNASTYAVEAVIPVGITPEEAVYDNWTNSVFIVDLGSANVTEIDASTFASIGNITVGIEPQDIALDPHNGTIYVDASTSANITGFNPLPSFHYVASISLTGGGGPMIVDAANGDLYVSGTSSGVQIWNLTTQKLLGSIALPPGGASPWDGLALDPSDNALFVAGYWQNVVEKYAPAPTTTVSSTGASGTTNLTANAGPDGLVYDPQLNDVIVVNQGYSSAASSNVTSISAANSAIVAWGPLADLPYGIAYGGPGDAVYVYDGQTGDLDILNGATEQIEHSVFVGFSVIQHEWIGGYVAYDSASGTVYVDFDPYTAADGDVAIVNLTTYAVTYLPTADFSLPAGIAYDATDGKVFVANYGGSNVTILDASDGAVDGWVPVGGNPLGVLFDPGNDTVFVTNYGSDNVSVILASSNEIVKTPSPIDVSGEPAGLALDPATGEIYVAESDADYVANFSSTKYQVNAPIYVSATSHPEFVAYDPLNETLLFTEPWPVAGIAGGELGFVNTTNGTYYGHLVLGDDLGPLAWDSETNSLFVSGTYPGAVYKLSTGATVPPPPPSLGATLKAVPATVEVNSTSELETTVTGATASLQYVYSDLPPGCTTADEATLACSPNATGTYSITVTVTQSGGGLAHAMTTLNVTPRIGPLGVTLQSDPSVLALGATTTLTATVSGGVGPFSFDYSALPPGCATEDESSLACTPSVGGSFEVRVNVTDAAEQEVDNTTNLTVGSLTVSLSASLNPIVLGQSSTLTVVPGGAPVGGLTYRYEGLPTGCSSQDTSALVCTPSVAGNFTPTVEANDSVGDMASASTYLNVSAQSMLTVSLVANPATIILGASTTLDATPSGGLPPYQFVYNGLPTGCVTADEASLPCSPTVSGSVTITVNVSDSDGHNALGSTSLTVEPKLSATLVATPSSISLGASSTLVVTVAGGYTGTLTYQYTELPPGCSDVNASSLVCTPTANGTYHPQVEVTDSSGHSASAAAVLSVTTPGSGSSTASSPFPWTWVAGGAIGAAALIIILLAWRRRKKPVPEPTSGAPTSSASATPPPTGPPSP